MKKIKKIIKKSRRRLQWPVREITGPDVRDLEIHTDHEARTHTIMVPTRDVRDIEMLHEIGHATLCETVNPLFSTQYFEAAEIPHETLAPACKSASDWFIDEWVMGIVPDEERREIEEHARLAVRRLRQDPSGPPFVFCGAALMLAQAVRYCGWRAEFAGILAAGVQAFLAVNPAKPTPANLAAVVNGLLACWTPHRVHHVVIDGLDMWRLSDR